MKLRRRTAILLLLLAALIALPWFFRARWLPGLLAGIEANAVLIGAIENLVNIGGALVPAVIALLVLLGLVRRPAPAESLPLLRQVALEELRRGLGRDGGISWIPRDATHPDTLMSRRRVAITGVAKVGKTREAIELIQGALKLDLFTPSRIYQPTAHLRGTDPQSIAAQIAKDVQSTDRPLLIFLDDLPREFQPGELDRLSAVFRALRHCTFYVIATARLDQLEEEHKRWLIEQNFEAIPLPGLDAAQAARLVDSAAGLNNIQTDEAARQALIAGNDGTPELTLLTFRRMAHAHISAADRGVVEGYAASSIIQQWRATRQDLTGQHPEAAALFHALAVFYASRVTPYTDLVLPLAAHHLTGVARVRRLKALLPRLAHYNIRLEGDRVAFPDYIAEAEVVNEQLSAQKELANFLLSPLQKVILSASTFWPSSNITPREDSLVSLGLAFQQQDRLDEAEKLLVVANRIRPLSVFLNNRGNLHAYHGREAEALADYTEAIRLNPAAATAFNNRGLLHADHSREAEALADYTEAIRLDPADATAFYNRGNLHANHGREAEALADYTEAIRLNPTDTVSFVGRGFLHANSGRETEALADYNEATRLDPANFAPFVGRGILYANNGRQAEALDEYEEAIRLKADDATAFYWRGILHAQNSREEEALADYNEAIRLDPNDATAFNRRGLLHAENGRATEALADFTEAIRLDPDDATAFYNRGILHGMHGRPTEALTDYNEAIRLDSTFDNAFYNRGIFYADHGRLSEALADFTEAIRLNSTDASYHYFREGILQRMDKSEETSRT